MGKKLTLRRSHRIKRRKTNRRKRILGGDNSELIRFSEMFLSKLKGTWSRRDDNEADEAESGIFDRISYTNGHKSRIFDDDTLHDRINPIEKPYDYEDTLFVTGIVDKLEKNSIIIDRQTLLSLDDKYAIYKDYGWGSHLLGLNSLIDSASTPGINKYMSMKGDYAVGQSGICVTDRIKRKRSFDLNPQHATCVDIDDSISRGDMYIYNNLPRQFKYQNVQNVDKLMMNTIIFNVVWRFNLYYCIAKCVNPHNPIKYGRALDVLNNLIFTGFVETESSYIPTFTFWGQDTGLPRDFSNHLENIAQTFDKLFKRSLDRDIGPFIDNTKSTINTDRTKIKMAKPIPFRITQNLIGEKIISIIGKNNDIKDGDSDKAYNKSFILPRGGTSTEQASACVHKIDNIFCTLYPSKTASDLKIQRVFMFRLLKFMGDRSHISISKLVQNMNSINSEKRPPIDGWKQPLLLTGERPLQISTINEDIVGAFEKLSVHDRIFNRQNKISSKDFILYVPTLSFKQYCEIVSLKIVQAHRYRNRPIQSFGLRLINPDVYADITQNNERISITTNYSGKDNFMELLKKLETEPTGLQLIKHEETVEVTKDVYSEYRRDSEKWNTYREVSDHEFTSNFHSYIRSAFANIPYLNNEMKTYGKRKNSPRDDPCVYSWDPSLFFFYKLFEPKSDLSSRKTIDALRSVQRMLLYIISLQEHIDNRTTEDRIKNAANNTLGSLVQEFIHGENTVIENLMNSLNVKKKIDGTQWIIKQQHNDVSNVKECNNTLEGGEEFVITETLVDRIFESGGQNFDAQCCADLQFGRVTGFSQVSLHRIKLNVLTTLLAIRPLINRVYEIARGFDAEMTEESRGFDAEMTEASPNQERNGAPEEVPLEPNVPPNDEYQVTAEDESELKKKVVEMKRNETKRTPQDVTGPVPLTLLERELAEDLTYDGIVHPLFNKFKVYWNKFGYTSRAEESLGLPNVMDVKHSQRFYFFAMFDKMRHLMDKFKNPFSGGQPGEEDPSTPLRRGKRPNPSTYTNTITPLQRKLTKRQNLSKTNIIGDYEDDTSNFDLFFHGLNYYIDVFFTIDPTKIDDYFSTKDHEFDTEERIASPLDLFYGDTVLMTPEEEFWAQLPKIPNMMDTDTPNEENYPVTLDEEVVRIISSFRRGLINDILTEFPNINISDIQYDEQAISSPNEETPIFSEIIRAQIFRFVKLKDASRLNDVNTNFLVDYSILWDSMQSEDGEDGDGDGDEDIDEDIGYGIGAEMTGAEMTGAEMTAQVTQDYGDSQDPEFGA